MVNRPLFRNLCSFRPLFQICDILCYSKIVRLDSTKVSEVGAKFANFHPLKFRGYREGPSALHYKIHQGQHFNILAKAARGGVLWPRRSESKVTVTKTQLIRTSHSQSFTKHDNNTCNVVKNGSNTIEMTSEGNKQCPESTLAH